MGYLRFSFMLAVLITHLVGGMAGPWAVYGFYIMSGFLITLVSCEVYGNTARGRALFLANRALRIYPVYWAAFIVCYLCHIITNYSADAYCFDCKPPQGVFEWLRDLSMIGIMQPLGMPARTISNVVWTLSNELVFYVLIGLVTAHSRLCSAVCFLASLALAQWIIQQPALEDSLYFSMLGTAHHFFLGSVIYHFRKPLHRLCLPYPLLLLAAANLVLYVPAANEWASGPLWSIYLRTLPLAYIVLSLWLASTRKPASRAERWLEDVTFPLYLIHSLVTAAILYHVFGGYRYGWDVFAAGFAASLAISALILQLVERPLKRLRRHVRSAALGKEPVSLRMP